MGGVKTLIVLPVAALNLAVMPWCVGTDQLVPDAVTFQMCLKKSRLIPVCCKTVGKFRSIIGLDAFNGAGKGFHKVVDKECGGISAVFLKSLHVPPSGKLINGSILEEMFSDHLTVHKTGGRDKLHIYLNALSGMVHLFIGLRGILRVRRMDSHDALFFEETVKSGNGAGVTALHEFYPEDD